MFSHRSDTDTNWNIIAHWFLLAFNAGCINAGGFLATGRFVSHVTGFATLFGVDLIRSEYKSALSVLSVPLFFMFGALLAGLFIDRPISQSRRPRFDLVMGLSAFCLFLTAAVGGQSDPHQTDRFNEIYMLSSLLCLACGLQNGAITSSSGSTIRTTHLTGLTTDLGLGVARLLNFKAPAEKRRREIRLELLRSGSILSFVLGSAVGAYGFSKFGYREFVLCGLIAAYAAWNGRHSQVAAHRQ